MSSGCRFGEIVGVYLTRDLVAGQVRVTLSLIKMRLDNKKNFLPGVDGQLRVHGEVHGNRGGDPDAAQRWPGGRWHPGQAGVPQVGLCLKIDWRNKGSSHIIKMEI